MIKKKNNLLIVGGSGFLGSSLVSLASKKGYKVFSLSRYKVKNKIKGVKYLNIDLSNKKKLYIELYHLKIHYVVYTAGYIEHEDFDYNGLKYINSNIKNFSNLIFSINAKNLIKFINISSSDEYGKSPAPQKELKLNVPLTPYGILKSYNSYFLKFIHKSKKFTYLNVYTFLIYGPGQKEDRLVPSIINSLLNNKTFKLQKPHFDRDLLYIDDFTILILKLIKNSNLKNTDVNIGYGKATNLGNLTKKIYLKISKGGLKIIKKNNNKQDVIKLYPNLSKIRKHLKNWKPKVNLDDGINRTIDYYKKLI